jgi:hypothetical protein
MTAHDNRDDDVQTALPELERLLLRAAKRRATRQLGGGRRWLLGIAAGSLVVAGGAAAATDVLHISSGTTSEGNYSIERRPPSPDAAGSQPAGSVCLQLRSNGDAPAFGCGDRPTAARPFGIVIADSVNASRDRVIYGLVSSDISRVSVLGDGDRHTDTATRMEPSLPGRFFSVVVPNRGRIELVGYDDRGREQARIGSRERPDHPPRSHDDAVAQGDPAGFAPAVAMPTSFRYRGGTITPTEAARRGLSCAQDRQEVRCYDSLQELDAEHAGGIESP